MIATPSPGTEEAQRLGCICPVIDNHYGKGIPYPEGPMFIINGGCPLHDPNEQITPEINPK